MTFTAFNTGAADQLVSAICNTLVHSLWQGILLAALAGLAVLCTKTASSALRYNLLIGALLLFAAGVVVTFSLQFKTGSAPVLSSLAKPLPQNGYPVNADQQAGYLPVTGFTDLLSGYLNSYRNTIVLWWFLIICAKSIQLGVGLYGTYRLRNTQVFTAGDFWDERIQKLAAKVGVRQVVTLLESGLAKVPMVIGSLKPVILIPIGLLTALSAAGVEAILVHELAHIRRRDYLVNMLQSVMEIIFFFNPAVLWISQLIKTERENCCDDLVLEQSSNKEGYIRALLSCEEYRSAIPPHAMALPGSKNNLLDRVRRLAGNRNHSLNIVEKTALAACLAISGLCLSAYAARKHIKHTVSVVLSVAEHKPLAALPPVSQIAILKERDAKSQKKIQHIKNIILQPMPPADTVSRAASTTVNLSQGVLNPKLSAGNGIDTGMRPKTAAGLKKFHEVARELYILHLVTDTTNISINFNQQVLIVNGVRMPETVHLHMLKKFDRRFGVAVNHRRLDSLIRTGQINPDVHSAGQAPYYRSSPYYQSKYKRYYPYVSAYTPEARRAWAHKDSIANKMMTDDLIKDGIISSADQPLIFKLSNKEFIVNGKKQDDAVYERYKQKYVPSPGNGDWSWTHVVNQSKAQ